MEDFTKYIPKNSDWINPLIDKMSWIKLEKYLGRLYKKLMNMKIGESINLLDNNQVKEENRELFIQCVWYYIVYHPDEFNGFEFNKTATILTRKKSIQELTKK